MKSNKNHLKYSKGVDHSMEYVPKKGKYILPRNLYLQTLYQIRDFNRLKEKAESIMTESQAPDDGQPKSKFPGDITASKAQRREMYLKKIKIIERSLLEVPEEYRNGVWENVMHKSPYPEDANRTTYGRYKSKFIYEVARALYLI